MTDPTLAEQEDHYGARIKILRDAVSAAQQERDEARAALADERELVARYFRARDTYIRVYNRAGLMGAQAGHDQELHEAEQALRATLTKDDLEVRGG